MLEHKIDQESFDSLGEAVQPHYSKEGDNYFLQAVGLVPKSKLDEFRANNITLKKTTEEYETNLADLQAQLKTASSGVDEDKVNVMVEEKLKTRIKALQEEHEKTLNDEHTARTKAESSLNSLLINDAISREAIAGGVRDTALEDVLMRANSIFKVVDGKSIPFDGDEPIYGNDGTTPLSAKDWLAGQATTRPHWFKESTGGGAENKNGGGAAKKEVSRNEWDTMQPSARLAFAKSGGAVK